MQKGGQTDLEKPVQELTKSTANHKIFGLPSLILKQRLDRFAKTHENDKQGQDQHITDYCRLHETRLCHCHLSEHFGVH